MEIKRTIPKGAGGSKDFKTKKIFVGGIPTTVNDGNFSLFFWEWLFWLLHGVLYIEYKQTFYLIEYEQMSFGTSFHSSER